MLLIVLAGVRWMQWREDHPPITPRDTRLRRLLSRATIQWGPGGAKMSTEQQKELVAHFWTAAAPNEAQNPSPGGSTSDELYFHPSPQPGQGSIVLAADPAFDYLSIEWWSFQPEMGGSPPTTKAEEQYELHPATSRFLRAWIARHK